MIIACVACSTRYVVPDAKIVGRKVRTVCKRCGAGLLVDGTHEPPRIIAENVEAVQRSREEYMVAFSIGQKESISIKRIIELYAAGDVSTSTYAWREGMEKWLTLFEIDAIATELRTAGYLPVIGARVSDEDEDAMTRVARHLPEEEEDDMTRIAKRPAASKPPKPPEDDDATQVFRPDQMREQLDQALAMAEGNADSVTKVASASALPPALPPEVPQARPASVPPPRRISIAPTSVPVAEMLLEPTSTMSMSQTVLTKQKRRNPVLWAFVVLTLAAAVVLVVLYITGRWPLVTRATAELGARLMLVGSR